MPPSKRKGRLCQTAGPVFMGLRVLSNMELLFKGVLEHLGEVDALFLGGGVQPRRDREGLFDRLFEVLLA